MEEQAKKYLKDREWLKAADLYTSLLQNKPVHREDVILYLFDRSECLQELGKHDLVVMDCRDVLKLLGNKIDDNVANYSRKRLIQALFILKRYAEAEVATREWVTSLKKGNCSADLIRILHNLLDNYINITTHGSIEHVLTTLDMMFPARSSSLRKQDIPTCIYCNITFQEKSELRAHCQTEAHELVLMSDEGHDWRWRAPPRGIQSDAYTLCENWKETKGCRYGAQCVEAHGIEELTEWKERFNYRQMKLQRAREKELYGKSYTEELLEKWTQASNLNNVMIENVSDVQVKCSSSLNATVNSKNSVYQWSFVLTTTKRLKAVALLQDTYRNHFFITAIQNQNGVNDISNNQEWFCVVEEQVTNPGSVVLYDHKVQIMFRTNIFGTFRQSVVFDFNSEPVLVKHLCVDVVPDLDLEKVNEIRKEITVSMSERWTESNAEIIKFSSTLVSFNNQKDSWEQRLLDTYKCPNPDTFALSNATVNEKKFTKNNYRERMHELLFVEEIARYDLIAKYNLTAKLQIAHSYILSPNSMAASTAKYSCNGELFAHVSLGKELSEDTVEGRLILMHCMSVYLCPKYNKSSPPVVYEAYIEDKGKNVIYLRLSTQTVNALNLKSEDVLEAQIQFQLNRLPYCEWHYILDKMQHFKVIFPETFYEPQVPWSPQRQWSRDLDSRLNLKQKEAVMAITTPLHVCLPPILVIGPFGTGKTFTLAQGVRELIKDSSNRILLCTHSNSAADLYIKDYFDQWVQDGNESAKPLRIYYQKRWVTSINPTVQKYCLIEKAGSQRNIKMPTIEDVQKHRIIVVTLSTSVYLSAIGLPRGYFTHILLDEAAQAIECETITPLAMAAENTRIVLAGDHMQLGPDIFSHFVRERGLQISLLERLYDHYPANFTCKILLCENYRAHQSIIQFTSDSFYDQKLVASSVQPPHAKFHPLTFFTTRGEDVQDKNSTAFYNNSEVYEVVERVAELKKSWPNNWGELNDQSIGVVTPYSDQVFRIRSELKKRRLDNVCVERVLNVQGKQFRVIILSTVRTRKTCVTSKSNSEGDYGFLSNSKLLNTAITRAQSLVAVVGDPVALCSLGRCSKVWERFIQVCRDNESLFGITWSQLKCQLDGIELKKVYSLNPLAPEFIPRKYREQQTMPVQQQVKQILTPNASVHSSPMVAHIAHVPPATVPAATPIIPPTLAAPFPLVSHPELGILPMIYPPQMGIPIPRHLSYLPINNGFAAPVRLHAHDPHHIPMKTDLNSLNRIPDLAGVQKQPQLRQPSLRAPQKLSSSPQNGMIQFMNNVHLPTHVISDCINLLPHNMSLADMLLQPPHVQEQWYNHLNETSGRDAGEKFKYLLHTTNKKGSRVINSSLFDFNNKLHSCESPTFNWYDSPSNQINFNKPIYMKDSDLLTRGIPLYQRRPSDDRQLKNVTTQVTTATNSNNAINNPIVNGSSTNNYSNDLQKLINEQFANLNINGCSDDTETILKTLSQRQDSTSMLAERQLQSGPPLFYKNFS